MGEALPRALFTGGKSMRIPSLLVLMLGLCPICPAQRLTVAQFRALERACVPEADGRDLLALARTESNLNPWALSVNRPATVARRLGYRAGRMYLKHQPKTKAEAIRWARELSASGVAVSAGILQVNLEVGPYPAAELLDPCTNLKQGWAIFLVAYRKETLEFGEGQRALLAAYGYYNAGSALAGFTNGYVLSILRNAY